MAKQAIRAKTTFVEGYNGPNTFAFQGQSPKGNRVVVEVDLDTIRKLAEFLRYTDSAGHAVWHLYSPETSLPCSMCTQHPKITVQTPDEQDQRFCRTLSEGGSCSTLKHFAKLYETGKTSQEEASRVMMQQCLACPEHIKREKQA